MIGSVEVKHSILVGGEDAGKRLQSSGVSTQSAGKRGGPRQIHGDRAQGVAAVDIVSTGEGCVGVADAAGDSGDDEVLPAARTDSRVPLVRVCERRNEQQERYEK